MTKETALRILEDMPDNEFDEFLNSLPMRTQLCIKGRLVNWQDVLPEWYINKGSYPSLMRHSTYGGKK